MDAKTISILLALLSAFGGVIAHAVAVDERSKTTQGGLLDVRGYLTAAEGRISLLERDRRIDERIQTIEIRLATMEERTRHK